MSTQQTGQTISGPTDNARVATRLVDMYARELSDESREAIISAHCSALDMIDSLNAIIEQRAAIQQARDENAAEMNRLTLFVRREYAYEMVRGRHSMMKTSVDVAIHYMAIERGRWRIMLRNVLRGMGKLGAQ